jgi:hypothetical protein
MDSKKNLRDFLNLNEDPRRIQALLAQIKQEWPRLLEYDPERGHLDKKKLCKEAYRRLQDSHDDQMSTIEELHRTGAISSDEFIVMKKKLDSLSQIYDGLLAKRCGAPHSQEVGEHFAEILRKFGHK